MQESTQGVSGGFSTEVTLDELAKQDVAREAMHDYKRSTTRRRNGNKGSRTWGFMAPGAGNRKRS